jgi:hypothetical protein
MYTLYIQLKTNLKQYFYCVCVLTTASQVRSGMRVPTCGILLAFKKVLNFGLWIKECSTYSTQKEIQQNEDKVPICVNACEKHIFIVQAVIR